MMTVKTFPDLSAAMLKAKKDLAYRLWLLCRQAAPCGWLSEADVFGLSVGNKRQTRAWLRQGEGLLWTRAGDRYYLAGLGSVCEKMAVRCSKAPVDIPERGIESLADFRALLFSTWFVGKPTTISQSVLSGIFGKSDRTLRTYCKRANVNVTHNLAWSKIPHDGDPLELWPAGTMEALGVKVVEDDPLNNVWREGWREYPRRGWRYERGDKAVLCWALPNTYQSDLAAGPKTRLQKEAARRGRRALDKAARANGGQYVRLFFAAGQAALAAKSLQRGNRVAFLEEGVLHHDRQLWSFNAV